MLTYKQVGEEGSFIEQEVPTQHNRMASAAADIKKKPAVSTTKKNCALPKFSCHMAEEEPRKKDRMKKNGNILDRFLRAVFGAIYEFFSAIFGGVLNMAPSAILLVAFVAYWAHKIWNQEEVEDAYVNNANVDQYKRLCHPLHHPWHRRCYIYDNLYDYYYP